jgi:hypothetical protein
MKKILIGIVVLLLSASAWAGEITLGWDASYGATGYRIYTSGETQNYADVPVWDGNALVAALSGLPDNCVMNYAVATAYNTAGESGYSNEVAFVSRPWIDRVPPPGPGNWLVEGENFTEDVQLSVATVAQPGVWLPITGAVRQDCQNVTIPVVEMPVAPDYYAMQVCTQGNSTCAQFLLTPDAPQNLRVN